MKKIFNTIIIIIGSLFWIILGLFMFGPGLIGLSIASFFLMILIKCLYFTWTNKFEKTA